MSKQTAANNATLAETKRIFNSKIYHKAIEIMNAGGETATLNYLQQFVRTPINECLFGTRYQFTK